MISNRPQFAAAKIRPRCNIVKVITISPRIRFIEYENGEREWELNHIPVSYEAIISNFASDEEMNKLLFYINMA